VWCFVPKRRVQILTQFSDCAKGMPRCALGAHAPNHLRKTMGAITADFALPFSDTREE
jgi:hypothetical protein